MQKNPKAAALAYKSSEHNAPKLVAKAQGELAHKIIQKAQEFGVPLFTNEILVDSLLKMPLDSEIPKELYVAVARVFRWILDSEKKAQLSGE